MTIVRDQLGALNATGGASTLVITWGSLPRAGTKVLVAFVYANATPNVTSVKDNGAVQSTFTNDVSLSSGGAQVAIYRADGITLPGAGSYTVTVTLGVSTAITGAGFSYTGVTPGAPSSSNNGHATSTSVSTGTATPKVAGALFFGMFGDDSSLNPETITLTASGFIQQAVETNGASFIPFAMADKIDAAGPSATAATWTLGDSVFWLGLIAAYDAAPPSLLPANFP